jgi:hypothetical protein
MTDIDWEIGLYDSGDVLYCFYSYFCCPCALASSRSYLDDSSWLYNIFCSKICITRWLIRSAYSIEGHVAYDVMASMCCPCCIVNQMLQTTMKHRNLSNRFGSSYNKYLWTSEKDWDIPPCILSTFTMPCLQGMSLQRSLGMKLPSIEVILIICWCLCRDALYLRLLLY